MDTYTLSLKSKVREVVRLTGQQRGWQTALAKRMGITKTSLNRWINEKEPFPPDRLRQLEDYLGLPQGWLDMQWADANSLNAALRASGVLRRPSGEGADEQGVNEASIEPEGFPKHLRRSGGVSGGVDMLAKKVAEALAEALQENEVGGTKAGRAWLIGQLVHLQLEFRREGYDSGAFADVIDYLLSLDRKDKGRK